MRVFARAHVRGSFDFAGDDTDVFIVSANGSGRR
jgi:hypothetical protein